MDIKSYRGCTSSFRCKVIVEILLFQTDFATTKFDNSSSYIHGAQEIISKQNLWRRFVKTVHIPTANEGKNYLKISFSIAEMSDKNAHRNNTTFIMMQQQPHTEMNMAWRLKCS